MSSRATIASIHIYPIKSLGGVQVQTSLVRPHGLEYDRRWMLVDADGLFRTQRSNAELCLFRVAIADSGLSVTGPDGEILAVPFAADGDTKLVRVWNSDVKAREVSSRCNEWFSDRIGERTVLVHFGEEARRDINPDWSQPGDQVSFADGFPVMVANLATLEDLNQRLDAPVPMNRFRPNVVLSGIEPYHEDTWKSLTSGDVQLDFPRPCGRCLVTTTDQDTARRGVEPLATLAKYRIKDQNVIFGMNAIPRSFGTLHVGATVELGA